jgi:DNA-binding MarR family transcriptional regulator
VRRVPGEQGAPQAPFDPIAEAVRQWAAHDLGAGEHMEATTALMRIQQLIVARVDAELRQFQLTFAQYEALVLLHFSRDGALPLGRMGRRLMVHPATVTNTVDQLESKQLVKRQPHVADRRSVLAKITRRGRTVAIDASDALIGIKFGIGDMTGGEARAIAGAIHDFRHRIADFPS